MTYLSSLCLGHLNTWYPAGGFGGRIGKPCWRRHVFEGKFNFQKLSPIPSALSLPINGSGLSCCSCTMLPTSAVLPAVMVRDSYLSGIVSTNKTPPFKSLWSWYFNTVIEQSNYDIYQSVPLLLSVPMHVALPQPAHSFLATLVLLYLVFSVFNVPKSSAFKHVLPSEFHWKVTAPGSHSCLYMNESGLLSCLTHDWWLCRVTLLAVWISCVWSLETNLDNLTPVLYCLLLQSSNNSDLIKLCKAACVCVRQKTVHIVL